MAKSWNERMDEKYGAFVLTAFRRGRYRQVGRKEYPTVREALRAAELAEKRDPRNTVFVDIAPHARANTAA